jgi:pimeloyl-ACP methyl ester carboxylesterase
MRYRVVSLVCAGAALIATAACGASATSSGPSVPGSATGSGAAPASGAGSNTGTDQEVSFTAGQLTVHGSLRVPAGTTGPVPAAVLLAGSGPTDRNGNTPALPGNIGTLSSLADVLAAAGVASLRYDKLSSGATGLGPYTSATIGNIGYSDFVDEGRAALQFLAGQPGVDATRLLLVGHSEGALISLSLAAQPAADQPALAGIALLEAPGSRYLDLISTQLTAALPQLVAAGKVSSDEAATVTGALPTAISTLRSTGAFPPGLPTLLQQQGLSAVNAHFLAQADAADPVQLAGSLPAGFKVLTSCSQKDQQVPCSEMAKLGAGLAGAALTPVTLTTADHFLKDEPPGTTATSLSELSFSQELPPQLTAWLQQAVG